ncbi:MAG TPA: thiolase family protein [Polyangiaceae bacterium]|nr:thiolase family protein [Polyangiaceae bacterium]
MQSVYIASAARTPIGSYLGSLSSMQAPQLGATALGAALSRAGMPADAVQQVYMGNVLSAGIGQAPARQAALKAGLPIHVPCTTVSKVCGSSLEAVVLAARAVASGEMDVILAGGMESMSNAPYYLTKARTGYRMGNGQVVDGMIFDGLWDPYNDFHMGVAGEMCAKEYNFSRQSQDDFAAESYKRATTAQAAGAFRSEIVAVSVPQAKGATVDVSDDEEPARGDPTKFSKLKPAFAPDGTITAANASSISDGAAALLIVSEDALRKHNLTPLARIRGHATAAQDPKWFTTAPAAAISALLLKQQLNANDVDLWEINEAFACVTQACAKLVGIELDKVNVKGGAVALGHPIGATGARILTTLLYALNDAGKKRGVASLCIGGGEAIALMVERD